MNEKNLKDFALDLFSESKDWDGSDLEELAAKYGLLIPVTRFAPCSMEGGCQCAQVCNDEDFAIGVECYNKADYLFVDATKYTRPELTNEDHKQAEQDAGKLLRKYGLKKFAVMLAALCLENVRLVKEINEHRAARGIEPLPTFEV